MKKLKRQVTDWENLYTNHISQKGLGTRIYKNSHSSEANKRTEIQLENGKLHKQTLFNRLHRAIKPLKR